MYRLQPCPPLSCLCLRGSRSARCSPLQPRCRTLADSYSLQLEGRTPIQTVTPAGMCLCSVPSAQVFAWAGRACCCWREAEGSGCAGLVCLRWRRTARCLTSTCYCASSSPGGAWAGSSRWRRAWSHSSCSRTTPVGGARPRPFSSPPQQTACLPACWSPCAAPPPPGSASSPADRSLSTCLIPCQTPSPLRSKSTGQCGRAAPASQTVGSRSRWRPARRPQASACASS
mmetsp:Transcript_18812/g.35835  ORF Transcript_18812/g.35835 Transcript_18812/m.35835 type:complete len:229 (-) Transcript_18812:3115-3801(-)